MNKRLELISALIPPGVGFADVGTDEIRQMLESADLNTLTPIEAMNLLFELQKKARG